VRNIDGFYMMGAGSACAGFKHRSRTISAHERSRFIRENGMNVTGLA
jgi:hypothetical protein